MPSFVEKYTPNMREALFHAAIDLRMGAKGALRAAGAGTLQDLSAEDQQVLATMNYSYAAALVKDERAERAHIAQVFDDATATAHAMAARMAALADRELRRVEQRGKKTRVDAGAVIAAGKMMREAHALAQLGVSSGKDSGKAPAVDAPAPAQPQGLAARIAAGGDSADGDAPEEPSDHGSEDAPRDESANGKPNDGDAGAVRSLDDRRVVWPAGV